VALLCALALGAVLGTFVGVREVKPYGHSIEYTKLNGVVSLVMV
jgi:hypothetical protein